MAQDAALREMQLGPRLLLSTLGGDAPGTSYGANCLAFAGRRGTLLVDPLIAPAHARLVAAALAARGFPPVTHVALTHHHTDHALGAGYFAARGATVIAHRACAAAMAAEHPALVTARRKDPALAALFADAEPHAPAITFEARHAVDLGDVGAELLHLGAGHTAGDAVVLLPSESTVATGDLVSRGYHWNCEEADLAALPATLARLRALPAARVVPGHGAPGGPELVDAQARYHSEIDGIVAAAGSRAAARTAIRAAFPGFLLEAAIESALDARGLREAASGRAKPS